MSLFGYNSLDIFCMETFFVYKKCLTHHLRYKLCTDHVHRQHLKTYMYVLNVTNSCRIDA